MKSTSKKRSGSKKVQKRTGIGKGAIAGIVVAVLLFLALIGTLMLILHDNAKDFVSEYEKTHYRKSLYKAETFASQLCVTDADVAMEGYTQDASLHDVGLFDVQGKNVLYADQIFEPLYPASTTKIMTALLTLENLNLSQVVTIKHDITFPDGAAVAIHLKKGDKITVEALLNALIIMSANDAAVALGEAVAGSEANFVKMMNKRAKELGATNTHFANPNGLHLSDHYSTAYDLYLIFKEVAKHNEFFNIAGRSSSRIEYLGSKGEQKIYDMASTNQYIAGTYTLPSQVYMIGGKTGTTTQAGSCLILLTKNKDGEEFISVVLKGVTKSALYHTMTDILSKEN